MNDAPDTASRRRIGLPLALAIAVALAVFGAEGLLWALRGFALPLLPYAADAMGVPSLLPERRHRVRMASTPVVTYATDAHGRRVDENAADDDLANAPGVEVLGDSQALGYDQPFALTFANRFGATVAPGAPVRILGAPSMDIESLALRVCGDPALGRQRAKMQLIVFNLGNDLDEMYIAGQGRRSDRTGALERWLIGRSQLYGSFAIWRSRQALAQHPLPGINPILFGLDSGERIVLARASVERVREIVRCTRAERRAVLILPSDFQVDATELRKYARFSADPDRFDEWYARREAVARSMNSIEDYLLRRLRAEGLAAVSFREAAVASGIPAERLFDRQSHHLTAEGHALAARTLQEALR